MRIIFDTNIYISHLLSTTGSTTIRFIINYCIHAREVRILLPGETLTELLKSVEKSAFLKDRITNRDLYSFIRKLQLASTILPSLESAPKNLVRDPSDDYLVSYSILHDADYLVTGDPDLLILSKVGFVQIVSPSEFLRIVRSRSK